ncbi:alpha-L-rhamnosidase, partial [Flavihumibacter sp. CACIAM 22H1]|uniref:alpha-L-rhamnosidase n=1 Tax=Flavihumibacter sp. CACIAM 22H1 TaxID=1812911 RepID=UPI0007A81420
WASFEMGLMNSSNWKGAWISDGKSMHEKALPYFRKEFRLDKKIKSARAYIAAGGLFELSINGQRISDAWLEPNYTRYDRRLLYCTYDITNAVSNGGNAAGVLVGNGWYNHQSTAVWDFDKAPWRNRPCFILDIRVEYTDGSIETISSNRDWKTSTGPVIFSSIYTAEHYDARLALTGWDQTGYPDTAWQQALLRSAPAALITAQNLHPIRRVEEIKPVSVRKFNDTVYVVDLGRNIAGVAKIKLSGAAGTVVKLRHSERLYESGRTDLSNIDVHYRPVGDADPFQTDIFILSGKGLEEFSPRFNYKGFQYIEVSASQPISITKESVTGYFMHSDLPAVSKLNSANPLLDKIWWATNNSYLSNMFGYPTDCPQREKNGWTGDAHIASETGLFNFDGITVYEKWLQDHLDEQQPNGVFPSIIPSNGWGYEWGNGPDWTSTIAIIPWNIYLHYGDTSLLAKTYDALKRYVNYIERISPDGICSWGLGDWVPVKSQTPVPFTSTAYYYTDALILSKAALLLGKSEDHERYAALAQKIYSAFNARFWNAAAGTYGTGLQTELSVALHWKLVPDSLVPVVAKALANRVIADGRQIDVGLLGTKTILNALSDNGYIDLAYELATRETFPSWGWWIKNGATTLFENWPINAKSDISMNHIMFGEIGAWMFKALGGIKTTEAAPGFQVITLEPCFPKKLNRFSCSHESVMGSIESAWERKGSSLQYSVKVPPGAIARLRVPASGNAGNSFIELGSGTHQFTWKNL